ncbi:acyl-CoA thioesterase domain-containing protein [Aestuariibacter salexigens]|uniref:acyl-CoA thioesterase domain-containing protein n=1 Tax=Aestuariibacter salexigens TaxID=226010 RepID=UPI00041489ED|nr:acyl-CoA thioesterase domain-containing protein [Aestuariibacter salexigens]
MTTNIKLSDLLQLESIESCLFRGQSWDLGFRALFGGQVLAQALCAAQRTVPEGRLCHSFHSYFLLPGDASLPVVYEVEQIRDGGSFSARRIKAIQNGKNIFYMTASFQGQEQGLEHQFADMPNVPPPDEVEPDIKCYENNIHRISERMREALAYHRPLDVRTVDAATSYQSEVRDPMRSIWMRAQEPSQPDLAINQAMLAYASDYHFLSTSLQPHGIAVTHKGLMMATIDHAMWFHRPFDFSEWLLYQMDSPFSGSARGLVRGQIFNKEGHLVASTMQEGLMRQVTE